MYRALLLLSVSSLLLAACAGMDGKPSIIMEQSASRPPPLPIAAPPAQKSKAKAKREAVPAPSPRPAPDAPPAAKEPPHKWYDHLKFWKN